MKITAFAGAAMALSALVAMTPEASAQGAPRPNYNSGDALREAEKLKPPVERPAPVPVIPQEEETPFSLPDGQTIFIRDFQLEGVELVDVAEVRALLEPYRNKDLTLTAIYEAAAKVTNYYRGKGFLVARAYVPKQDAGAGLLSIKVVIGRYGKISQVNSSLVRDFLIQKTFEDAMEAGQPVSKEDVERAMLLVSDMPGAQMPKITIAPGETPGTSDFIVTTEPANRIGGYVTADNYGSRYTGRDRLSAGLDINGPFGLADKLSLSGMTAEAAGLQNGRAAYSFPLFDSALRLELAVSRTTYALSDIYSDLDATGTANSWEGTLSYPLIRTDAETLSLSFNAAARRLQDKILDQTVSSKRAKVATLEAENKTRGTLFGFNATTNISTSATFGYLEIPDAAERQANEAGADTVGNYSKLNLSLGGTLSFTNELSLLASVKGQKALGKNLDGSEQMSISGMGGVESYAEGVTGDNGYLLNVEARYALPGIEGFNHAIGLFSDMGRVYIQDNDFSSDKNGTLLTDVGVGYYSNFEYSTGRYLVGQVRVAQTIGPEEDTGEKGARTKVLGLIGVTF